MAAVCQSVYLALGKSEDGTEEAVADLEFLKIQPTVWDESLREGGLILSKETNTALSFLRSEQQSTPAAWGIYLQCDEVIHEEDYQLIRDDLQKAEEQGCDVVRFRYLHFWQSHGKIAINKKWYPQEIRAVRLDNSIESWGDAQSFRNFTKAYESDARIFHYGHVREEDKYSEKKADILKLYHSDEKMAKYKRREKRFDDLTETLEFRGNHPLLMKERIEKMGESFAFPRVELVSIVGRESDYSAALVKKINAEKIIWVEALKELSKSQRECTVIMNPGFFDKLLRPSKIPAQMRSKLSRPWTNDFLLTLKLSESGVSLTA